MAYHEPPHQDLYGLQIQLFSSLVLKELKEVFFTGFLKSICINVETKCKHTCDLNSTMVQMAHFSFPYYFTIPNSEFRIPKFALRISEFEIRNCEVYIIWASGNS